jgi:hypothetical protein
MKADNRGASRDLKRKPGSQLKEPFNTIRDRRALAEWIGRLVATVAY